MKCYLAIDIGASSGRHIIGYYDENNKLVIDETYRFKNFVKEENKHLVWDIFYIFNEVKIGIKKSLEKYSEIESLSIDTWGVDYVLLNNDKEIFPVYAYRDNRTKKAIDIIHNDFISFENLYKITGTQFQSFNTIYQLYIDKLEGRLNNATDFLMIPEYLIYKLTGKKVKEYTNASTSGMLDLNTRDFSNEIINKLGFNKILFKKLYKKSYLIGDLLPEIQKEVNGNIKVKLCSTHDTASAVESINLDNYVPYISSGTWSLFGIKLEKGINSLEALKSNYSNEYGPDYIRFQKNIMGLWIIQNLSKELNIDFKEMINLAKKSSYCEIYDVNDECFLSPKNMLEEIILWYKRHNKRIPNNKEDILNATYHSLAYSYLEALDELEKITNRKYDKIVIFGGGAKNEYLNELTKRYLNIEVISLPIEASSIGNILNQMED